MSLPRYLEYKDSGVPWLGSVPTHWSVAPFKRLVEFRNGSDHKSIETDEGYPVYGSGGIFAYAKDFMHDGESVLLGRKGTVDRPLYVTGKFWTVDTMYWTQIASNACGKFCYYAATSIPFAYYSTNTALPSMTQGALGAHLMAFPDKAEQTAVACFLDRETAKIDAMVAEQEKLLALLAEKRQATISRAVTRGLDPNAPVKDSGIAWLGEVPAHWDVVPLKRMTDPSRPIMYGIVLPGPDVGVGVPILKGGNVKPARMNLESMARTTPEIEAPYARARLEPGDLVYAIRGTIGDCESVPREMDGANITQDVARVAVAATEDAGWVRWALLSAAIREELAVGSLGAAVRGVNIYDLKRVKVPRPPVAEQAMISLYLEERVGDIERLSMESTRAIALLKERRNALITAAVTGKIDVRGLVPSEAA